MKKKDYVPVYKDGSLILGQEQDGKPKYDNGTFDPIFDEKQAFSGKLTQVELWNVNLSPSEINDIAKCVVTSLKPDNRVITWGSVEWIAKQATVKDIPLQNLCDENLILNQFIWPRRINYNSFSTYCHTIHGIVFHNSLISFNS